VVGPFLEAGFNRLITGEEHEPNRIEAGVELEPNSRRRLTSPEKTKAAS
jgi:hypothetical protein